MNTIREHWGSKMGFVMAAAGSAIGLGSLWRFPYVAGDNGGGAFVLLYLIFTFLISLPVFIAALMVGRASQQSPVLAYSSLRNNSANWKLLGYLNMLTCFIILAYYCVVSGWCLNYALMSITQFTKGKTPEEIKDVFNIVYRSPDLNLFWLFIILALNVGIVLSGVRKGIERWSKILMPSLLLILVGLLVYGMTLDGFKQAFHFIFKPDFGKLSPSVILNALGMSFFTLSVGLGINVTYGSYLSENESIPKTSLIIAIMTVAVSLFAAMMIFPVVFTFDFTPEGGPGLIFQTMPVLFEKLPASLFLSTIFFVLVVFTALTSSIALLEVIVANLIETVGFSRKKAVLLTAGAIFLLGIPCALAGTDYLFPNWKAVYGKNFFDTMDYITASWMMPISALLTTLFVGWFLDKDIAKKQFNLGNRARFLYYPWRFFMRYLAPFVVIIILLQKGGIIDIDTMF